MGPQDQPDYVNAVAALHTRLAAEDLLTELQKIELEQGRQRKDERWGPRTLDLDILLFGHEIIQTERLTVPHYGMKQREFVLYPLAELNSDLVLPDGTQTDRVTDDCAFKRPNSSITVVLEAVALLTAPSRPSDIA